VKNVVRDKNSKTLMLNFQLTFHWSR